VHATFIAATDGPWRIDSIKLVAGDVNLPRASRLAIVEDGTVARDAAWVLRGIVSKNAAWWLSRE